MFSIGQVKPEVPAPIISTSSKPEVEVLTKKRKRDFTQGMLLATIWTNTNSFQDQEEWIVKRVVDHRKNGNRLEWLVLWENGEQSWEPRNCFIDADQSKNQEWAEYEQKRRKK